MFDLSSKSIIILIIPMAHWISQYIGYPTVIIPRISFLMTAIVIFLSSTRPSIYYKNILKITTTHFLWDNSNNIKAKKIIFSPNQVAESTISYSSSSGSS